MTTLALLHPGEMGTAVGICARDVGACVAWSSAGRSEQSRQRARDAGFQACESIVDLLEIADIAISVCPPHAAVDLAQSVISAGFAGLFVDANAIAPATARRISELMKAAGIEFLDAGIIGPPPSAGARSTLYLSGGDALAIERLFAGTPLSVRAIDGPVGVASALKACYAAWNTGATALLANVRALAAHEGVESALLDEWNPSQPDALKRSEHARNSARKAWRWTGEMDEIAATFRDAGLPDGFHMGASEVFRRLDIFKDRSDPPSIDEVTRAINKSPARRL